MRLTRVYVDATLAVGSRVALGEAASSHLTRVLRAGAGDACVLFNGDGRDRDARIVCAGKRAAEVEVLACRELQNESPLRIVLLQALARGEKMDWVVQKATELGVHAIVPVASERSEVRLDGERADRRVAHWRQVAIAACEQSGRALLPRIEAPRALADAAKRAADPAALCLLLDPESGATPASLQPAAAGTIAIAVGPEGGWSPRDVGVLRDAGFRGLRLGPRVLRTETAGVAAIAALQALHGDLR